MDSLQQQVSILGSKVDALYQLIEQLTAKVGDVATECKFGADQLQRSETSTPTTYRTYQEYGHADSSLEHKDVLVDNNHLEATTQGGEKQLSPEVQVQRLTAQLTAAYNRIAALEEQLLYKRIH